jgi:GNAT superfamily N-acetyltransferase
MARTGEAAGPAGPTGATDLAGADPDDVRRRMEATLDRYHLLGQEPIVEPLGTFKIDLERPYVWGANHVRSPRAATPDEVERLLGRLQEHYAGFEHLQIVTDLDTPDVLEARLALDGWKLDLTLQHLLVGDLVIPSGRSAVDGLAIDAVRTDDDWAEMLRLTRLDHLGEAAREGREPWTEELTGQMVSHRRRKAPEVQPWLARLDGEAVGMFSSLPGVDGVGLVEDLFVDQPARGRGVAQALIAHATADARSRGAGPVIIGSRPDDWPKTLYARMGFRPMFLERVWDLDVGLTPRPSTALP